MKTNAFTEFYYYYFDKTTYETTTFDNYAEFVNAGGYVENFTLDTAGTRTMTFHYRGSVSQPVSYTVR